MAIIQVVSHLNVGGNFKAFKKFSRYVTDVSHRNASGFDAP